ncbi:hypothetical protein HK101_009555, partial [Irineochytrium annulatum]
DRMRFSNLLATLLVSGQYTRPRPYSRKPVRAGVPRPSEEDRGLGAGGARARV